MQVDGCKSLTKMCELDASVAEAVAAAGAMGLFIKALILDTANDSTPVAAVNAIGAIALSKAALPQASAGIDVVMRALRRQGKISEFAEAACRTLGIYLRCPATRDRAVQAGAEAAIREALAKHSTIAAVQEAADEALEAPQA